MTHLMTSIDITTPVYNPRTLKLFLYHDPLNIGRREKYNFELEVFDTYDESSYAWIVTGNGKSINTGQEYNDYYGPGTSMTDAVEQATRWMDEIENIEATDLKVQVVMNLSDERVFRSEDKPFYRGAVRMFRVPGNWWLQGTTDYDEQPGPNKIEEVIWENGKWTERAAEIESLLISRHESDVMGAERINPLRPVARFTQGK
jgi:hypothetical protein